MIITIGGGVCTGTSSLGRALADRLGWEYFSVGDMRRKEQKDPQVIASRSSPEDDRRFDEKVRLLGVQHDKVVIEGRLPWYFIPDSFKILVVCGIRTRVQRYVADPRRECKDVELARTAIEIRDVSDRVRFRKTYKIMNFLADRHYDLMINTSKLNIEASVEAVCSHQRVAPFVPARVVVTA